jgi:hypothetical protein
LNKFDATTSVSGCQRKFFVKFGVFDKKNFIFCMVLCDSCGTENLKVTAAIENCFRQLIKGL